MKLIFSIILLCGAILSTPSASGQDDFAPHRVGPPQLPSASPGQLRVDAFMEQHGYRRDPAFVHFGTARGRNLLDAKTFSMSPGQRILAIIPTGDPACPLAVTYQDAGYTVGKDVFQAKEGDGFYFIPLDVASNLSSIMVRVQDADNTAGSRTCSYEYRLYGKS